MTCARRLLERLSLLCGIREEDWGISAKPKTGYPSDRLSPELLFQQTPSNQDRVSPEVEAEKNRLGSEADSKKYRDQVGKSLWNKTPTGTQQL